MDTKGNSTIDELFKAPETIKMADIDSYVAVLATCNGNNQERILHDVDNLFAKLQNHIQLLSMYFKQRYIVRDVIAPSKEEISFYTKQEVAVRYRVSMRTITNWIVAGLETTLIGGVIRISDTSLQEFIKNNRRRKYGWRSISKTGKA